MPFRSANRSIVGAVPHQNGMARTDRAVGIGIAFSHLTPVDQIVGTAQRLEEAGCTSMRLPEYVVFFADYESSYPPPTTASSLAIPTV